LRSTSDGVDQLREQLERERQQNRFNMAQMEREKALLIRYLLEAKAELALSMRSLPRRARRHN
jgi:hypothetical protein